MTERRRAKFTSNDVRLQNGTDTVRSETNQKATTSVQGIAGGPFALFLCTGTATAIWEKDTAISFMKSPNGNSHERE